jgi:hypothetical protein
MCCNNPYSIVEDIVNVSSVGDSGSVLEVESESEHLHEHEEEGRPHNL